MDRQEQPVFDRCREGNASPIDEIVGATTFRRSSTDTAAAKRNVTAAFLGDPAPGRRWPDGRSAEDAPEQIDPSEGLAA